MYYSDEIIEEVRAKNDIVDVISGYVKLQKRGSSHLGLCPFHNEKSPSFSVSRQRQMYHCFGCGAGGNVFTFLMEYDKLSFTEAVQTLADRAGVRLPKMEYSKEAKEKANLRTILLEINKAAAQYYYIQLRSERGNIGYRYLSERGLSDDILKVFGLGYSGKSGNDLYRYLRSKGYNEEHIRKAGLISTNEKTGIYDKFWNRVIFPIMDINSRVIGFGGRVMGEGKPKYLNSPETELFNKSQNLYGLHIARRTKESYFLLCEGYMDVIALHQAGFTNAVASLGTSLTNGHAVLMKRYVREVYLTYDSDDAGIKAALRAIPILREAGIICKVICLEPYKDPDEFIKNLGKAAFEQRIMEAKNGFLFSIEILQKDYNLHTPEGKTAFLQETARRIMVFEDELERNNYIETIADMYHTDSESLKKFIVKTAVNDGLAAPARRYRTVENPSKKDDISEKAQKILLTWLIDIPELFSKIRSYITPEDFTNELFRNVAQKLYEQLENNELNPARILNNFSEEEHREVSALFNTRIEKLYTKEEKTTALAETIYHVKKNSLNKQRVELKPGDIAGLQNLIREEGKLQSLLQLHISIK